MLMWEQWVCSLTSTYHQVDTNEHNGGVESGIKSKRKQGCAGLSPLKVPIDWILPQINPIRISISPCKWNALTASSMQYAPQPTATATKTLTRLGTPHGSRHSGANWFPQQLQLLLMRPSLTASYRAILFSFFRRITLLSSLPRPRRHLTLPSFL